MRDRRVSPPGTEWRHLVRAALFFLVCLAASVGLFEIGL
jgi:hypothetical protein